MHANGTQYEGDRTDCFSMYGQSLTPVTQVTASWEKLP
jgi:hypothetical protein